MQLDLQPANVRVKELETIVDELQSELQVKSKHMETLKNEKKSVMDKYLQLKRKQNFKEDDSVVLSQPTVLDSLEDEPEVKFTAKAIANNIIIMVVHMYVYVSSCMCKGLNSESIFTTILYYIAYHIIMIVLLEHLVVL